MSRGRRTKEHFALSLFPFIAVLLCTMGALVVFLLFVVSRASATSHELVLQRAEEIHSAADQVEMVSGKLESQRTFRQQQIESEREILTHLEGHIDRLMREFKQMSQVSEAMDSQASLTAEQRSNRREAIEQLRRTLAEAEKELAEKKDKNAKRPPVFAIVPYRGPNGTSRRPIYLECTDRGVVIQPDQVLVSLDDLRPPHGPGNPLDAALRLIRHEYQRGSSDTSETKSPYPLLIVRPNGIKSYVLARSAMSGWDDQFGYELVDQSLKLAYPPSGLHLEKELAQTIHIARQRQTALIAAMPRAFQLQDEWDSDSFGETRASRGGTVNRGDTWSEDDSRAAFDGNQWKMIQELPAGSMIRPTEAKQISSGRGNLGSFAPRGGNTTGLASGSMANPNSNTFPKGAFPGEWGLGGTGSNSGVPAQQPSRGGGNTNQTSNSSNASDNHPGGAGSAMDESLSNTASTGSGGSNPQASRTANSSRGAANAPVGSTGSWSLSGSPSGTPMGSDPTAASPDDPNSQNSLTYSVPATSDTSRAPSGRSGSTSSHPKKPSSKLKPISASQGKGWAASRANHKSTPIERTIRFLALSDRWILITDGKQRTTERVIELNRGPTEAASQLASAIHDRIDSWGMAVGQGYWKAVLMVEAAPDAQVSVSRMIQLLEESGADVKIGPITSGFITK